jgi:hypothetical protein
MSGLRLMTPLGLPVLWAIACSSEDALACAACYGKSDSPLAQGMNMGIVSLLGVIGVVLVGVAGFFVFLARQSARAALAKTTPPDNQVNTGVSL